MIEENNLERITKGVINRFKNVEIIGIEHSSAEDVAFIDKNGYTPVDLHVKCIPENSSFYICPIEKIESVKGLNEWFYRIASAVDKKYKSEFIDLRLRDCGRIMGDRNGGDMIEFRNRIWEYNVGKMEETTEKIAKIKFNEAYLGLGRLKTREIKSKPQIKTTELNQIIRLSPFINRRHFWDYKNGKTDFALLRQEKFKEYTKSS